MFSADANTIAFNSCHFYRGATLGVPTRLLPGLDTDAYVLDERLTLLDGAARVYAGASRADEFIFGDADGYLRAVGVDGTRRWRHFVGGAITAIDISRDGRTLVVGTDAGWLSIISLDAGEQPPYQIGDGGHCEQRRWLFWKNEPNPLIW